VTRNRKVSVYLTVDIVDELLVEAERQKRPLSWLLEHAWSRAKAQIAQFPSAPGGVPNIPPKPEGSS
jgi:uncharacterized small protein (TIGR04563 family)